MGHYCCSKRKKLYYINQQQWLATTNLSTIALKRKPLISIGHSEMASRIYGWQAYYEPLFIVQMANEVSQILCFKNQWVKTLSITALQSIIQNKSLTLPDNLKSILANFEGIYKSSPMHPTYCRHSPHGKLPKSQGEQRNTSEKYVTYCTNKQDEDRSRDRCQGASSRKDIEANHTSLSSCSA